MLVGTHKLPQLLFPCWASQKKTQQLVITAIFTIALIDRRLQQLIDRRLRGADARPSHCGRNVGAARLRAAARGRDLAAARTWLLMRPNRALDLVLPPIRRCHELEDCLKLIVSDFCVFVYSPDTGAPVTGLTCPD